MGTDKGVINIQRLKKLISEHGNKDVFTLLVRLLENKSTLLPDGGSDSAFKTSKSSNDGIFIGEPTINLSQNGSYHALGQAISGNYKRTLINNISVSDSVFANCDFEGAAITGAMFRNCIFYNVNFLDVALHHTTLENCILALKSFPFKHVGALGMRLSNCVLLDTTIQNVSLYSAIFHNVIMSGGGINTATLEKFTFDNCYLADLDLTCCNLHYAEAINLKTNNCIIGGKKLPWVIGAMDYVYKTKDFISFTHNNKKYTREKYIKECLIEIQKELENQANTNYAVNFALGNILSAQGKARDADFRYDMGTKCSISQRDYRLLNYISKALIVRSDITLTAKRTRIAMILNEIKATVVDVLDYNNFANHIAEIAVMHTSLCKIDESFAGELSVELLISLLKEIQVSFDIDTGVCYDSDDLKNLFEVIKNLYECEKQFNPCRNGLSVQLVLSHNSPINIKVIIADKSDSLVHHANEFMSALKEKTRANKLNWEITSDEIQEITTLADKVKEEKTIMTNITNKNITVNTNGNGVTNIADTINNTSSSINVDSYNTNMQVQQSAEKNMISNWKNQNEKLSPFIEGELQALLEKTPRYFNIDFLKGLMSVSKRICKIMVNFDSSIQSGTGLLINPQYILTCKHTFVHKKDVNKEIRKVIAIFDYDSSEALNKDTKSIEIDFKSYLPKFSASADLCLIRVDTQKNRLASANMARSVTIAMRQQSSDVAIIHHPKGHSKVVSMAHNKIVDYNDKEIQYKTDTQPGSSGAPVFDHQLNLIGIHTTGNKVIEQDKTYANAGVSSIEVNRFLRANNIILEER